MCSRCTLLLGDLCLPHDRSACPLRHALYCSVCASYGHDVQDCPEKAERYLTMEDSEEAMAAFVAEKGIVVPKGRSLRIAIEDDASLHHRRVRYLPVQRNSPGK